MPLTLMLLCPYHHAEESISLPDSYFKAFSGEVPCGAKGVKATLQIVLTLDGDIQELSLAREPPPQY